MNINLELTLWYRSKKTTWYRSITFVLHEKVHKHCSFLHLPIPIDRRFFSLQFVFIQSQLVFLVSSSPTRNSVFLVLISAKIRSRDSVVSIATGYGLDDRGIGVSLPVILRIFSSRRPARLWAPALSLEVKRPERQGDHSPPGSAEAKNMWIYTSTPAYAGTRTTLYLPYLNYNFSLKNYIPLQLNS
jgi:hypothetical protein